MGNLCVHGNQSNVNWDNISVGSPMTTQTSQRPLFPIDPEIFKPKVIKFPEGEKPCADCVIKDKFKNADPSMTVTHELCMHKHIGPDDVWVEKIYYDKNGKYLGAVKSRLNGEIFGIETPEGFYKVSNGKIDSYLPSLVKNGFDYVCTDGISKNGQRFSVNS